MKFAAVLLMGGEGSRCDFKIPKQFLPLGDRPLYEYALSTFTSSGLFDQIVVVTSKIIPEFKTLPITVVMGGATRQESSHLGTQACNKEISHVVIHDVARPFVSVDILKRNVEAVVTYGAINTCIPSFDTINQSQGEFVEKVIDRKCAFRGQTPQSFSLPLILEAHKTTSKKDSSDDCSLVLELGHKVHIVLGEEKNFKITTSFDLAFAKHLIYNHEN